MRPVVEEGWFPRARIKPLVEVQLRGIRGGLLVRWEGEGDFESWKEKLCHKMDTASKFFRGSVVTLDIGSRLLTTRQLLELENLFLERYGVKLLQVVNGSQERADWSSGSRSSQGTLLVKRTLRSGQRVVYEGNVVILGDVNPGAEVVAGGDIVVMGHLRGVAQAGSFGDDQAVVVAFRLRPTQLRVGRYIGRPPEDRVEEPDCPEIARVHQGELVIEPFLPVSQR